MQNGMYKLSDRVSNKNSNKNVGGVRGLMKEFSVYGDAISRMDSPEKSVRDEFWAEQRAQRDAKDAPIIAAYDAKKEELEHLYKMRDCTKKQSLISAKKAELDQMYNKYVCVRKHVYEVKQARKTAKLERDLVVLKKDLYSIAGRVMLESEFRNFLELVSNYTKIRYDTDGNAVAWFTLDYVCYTAHKIKNGYRWEVSL